MQTSKRKVDRIISCILKDATIMHSTLEELVPIDDSSDIPDVVETIRKLALHSLWGWCTVRTDIEYAGFRASVYLGCCSYDGADAFIRDQGETQAREAALALWQAMVEAADRGKAAVNVMRSLRAR